MGAGESISCSTQESAMNYPRAESLYCLLFTALLVGCQRPSPGTCESEPSASTAGLDRQTEVLNELSNEINSTYGYKDGIPRINIGPCGRFAKSFREQWNARFQGKITIVFLLAPDDHCCHILVKLPEGTYFDGGNGVMSGPTLLDKFAQFTPGVRIEEMVEFDLKLLDKHSHGLGRTYEHCPNYSDETTFKIIEKHLGKLAKNTGNP
jgi:hypothetical protein